MCHFISANVGVLQAFQWSRFPAEFFSQRSNWHRFWQMKFGKFGMPSARCFGSLRGSCWLWARLSKGTSTGTFDVGKRWEWTQVLDWYPFRKGAGGVCGRKDGREKRRKVAGNSETCRNCTSFTVGVTTVGTTHDRFEMISKRMNLWGQFQVEKCCSHLELLCCSTDAMPPRLPKTWSSVDWFHHLNKHGFGSMPMLGPHGLNGTGFTGWLSLNESRGIPIWNGTNIMATKRWDVYSKITTMTRQGASWCFYICSIFIYI